MAASWPSERASLSQTASSLVDCLAVYWWHTIVSKAALRSHFRIFDDETGFDQAFKLPSSFYTTAGLPALWLSPRGDNDQMYAMTRWRRGSEVQIQSAPAGRLPFACLSLQPPRIAALVRVCVSLRAPESGRIRTNRAIFGNFSL